MRDVVGKRPDASARLAARRLDLDDVGAEITQQLAAKLTGLVGQLQDAEAGQRARRQSLGHRSISS
jgi:hypothetical protein